MRVAAHVNVVCEHKGLATHHPAPGAYMLVLTKTNNAMLSGVAQKCVVYNERSWAFGWLTIYTMVLLRQNMKWPVQFALLRPPAFPSCIVTHTHSFMSPPSLVHSPRLQTPCVLARTATQGRDCARSSSNRRLTARDDACAGRCLSTSLCLMSRAALGAQCCCILKYGPDSSPRSNSRRLQSDRQSGT